MIPFSQERATGPCPKPDHSTEVHTLPTWHMRSFGILWSVEW